MLNYNRYYRQKQNPESFEKECLSAFDIEGILGWPM